MLAQRPDLSPIDLALIASAPITRSHRYCTITFGQGTTVQRRIVRHLGVSVGAFVDEPAGASGVDVN